MLTEELRPIEQRIRISISQGLILRQFRLRSPFFGLVSLLEGTLQQRRIHLNHFPGQNDRSLTILREVLQQSETTLLQIRHRDVDQDQIRMRFLYLLSNFETAMGRGDFAPLDLPGGGTLEHGGPGSGSE
jgi:hypothetical protein